MTSRLSRRLNYRAIVLEEAGIEDDDRRFTAVCIEQNLTGTGPSPTAAVEDLLRTIKVAVDEGCISRPDPDPELLQCFEDRASKETPRGDRIAERGLVVFIYDVHPEPDASVSSAPSEVHYELCIA